MAKAKQCGTRAPRMRPRARLDTPRQHVEPLAGRAVPSMGRGTNPTAVVRRLPAIWAPDSGACAEADGDTLRVLTVRDGRAATNTCLGWCGAFCRRCSPDSPSPGGEPCRTAAREPGCSQPVASRGEPWLSRGNAARGTTPPAAPPPKRSSCAWCRASTTSSVRNSSSRFVPLPLIARASGRSPRVRSSACPLRRARGRATAVSSPGE